MKKRFATFFAIAALVMAVSIPAEGQAPPDLVLVTFVNGAQACVTEAAAKILKLRGLIVAIGSCDIPPSPKTP